MSKLDRFVNVKYMRNISNFSDVDYDTVVVISNTIVGEGNVVFKPDGGGDRPSKPAIFTAASSFPETLGDLRNIGRRCLEHGRRVMFWDRQLKDMYCYLFADYVVPESDEEWKWETVKEGFDQFMLVFPTNLYFVATGKENETIPNNKYTQSQFIGADITYNPSVGSRIVVCGSKSGEAAVENSVNSNNLFIAASVAGVIAGGYRNFTTHLRQIISVTEDRQENNPDSNPEQCKYIGSVKLAGNSFIEGSMTRGADSVESGGDTTTTSNRKFIDRQVLEDRLRSRIQEECLRVMTHGNGVAFTESGANLIAGAGGIALAEAAGLNIIDDFETEVNYDKVTAQDIEDRHYKTLVYRFRFAGSIEFVEVLLEV